MIVDQRLIDNVTSDMDLNLAPLLPIAIITLICVGYLTRSLWAWGRFRL